MKIAIESADLHNPIFLAGTNLQKKLDPSKRMGLQLTYDMDKEHLLVHYKSRVLIVPLANVSGMDVPESLVYLFAPAEDQPAVRAAAPMSTFPGGKIKAQVSSPTDHVFAGPGGGRANDKGKVVL